MSYECSPTGRLTDDGPNMQNIPRPKAALTSKFLALKAAGFTNRDIIAAYKEGKLADLLALVDDASQ